jgi:thiamine-phosphate pyrophosphorylase
MEKIDRLIDANLNRLREGLRVLEDIARYIFDDKNLSSSLKDLRHSFQKVYSIKRVKARDILNDVGKSTTKSELKRENLLDLIIANFARVQESSRVLEEIFKLENPSFSTLFKDLRYQAYNLEKEFLELATTNITSNSK